MACCPMAPSHYLNKCCRNHCLPLFKDRILDLCWRVPILICFLYISLVWLMQHDITKDHAIACFNHSCWQILNVSNVSWYISISQENQKLFFVNIYSCHITWFCDWLIAKPGNKRAAPPWQGPLDIVFLMNSKDKFIQAYIYLERCFIIKFIWPLTAQNQL